MILQLNFVLLCSTFEMKNTESAQHFTTFLQSLNTAIFL